ncbi:MAG: hypothetical protein ACOCX8_00965 [Bacteroidota bacterium]
MLGKLAIVTGILAIVLGIAVIVIQLATPGPPAHWLYNLSALLMALVFTPLFFIHHYKKYDAYKIPCYSMSAVIGALLMIASLLSGLTGSLGEPNLYSGLFLLICFLLVILLFKPKYGIVLVLVLQVLVMSGALFSLHFLNMAA